MVPPRNGLLWAFCGENHASTTRTVEHRAEQLPRRVDKTRRRCSKRRLAACSEVMPARVGGDAGAGDGCGGCGAPAVVAALNASGREAEQVDARDFAPGSEAFWSWFEIVVLCGWVLCLLGNIYLLRVRREFAPKRGLWEDIGKKLAVTGIVESASAVVFYTTTGGRLVGAEQRLKLLVGSVTLDVLYFCIVLRYSLWVIELQKASIRNPKLVEMPLRRQLRILFTTLAPLVLIIFFVILLWLFDEIQLRKGANLGDLKLPSSAINFRLVHGASLFPSFLLAVFQFFCTKEALAKIKLAEQHFDKDDERLQRMLAAHRQVVAFSVLSTAVSVLVLPVLSLVAYSRLAHNGAVYGPLLFCEALSAFALNAFYIVSFG
ncbi:unnamed protein product, partial [Durusdinium trenchii]